METINIDKNNFSENLIGNRTFSFPQIFQFFFPKKLYSNYDEHLKKISQIRQLLSGETVIIIVFWCFLRSFFHILIF